jgi:hypothetical protein
MKILICSLLMFFSSLALFSQQATSQISTFGIGYHNFTLTEKTNVSDYTYNFEGIGVSLSTVSQFREGILRFGTLSSIGIILDAERTTKTSGTSTTVSFPLDNDDYNLPFYINQQFVLGFRLLDTSRFKLFAGPSLGFTVASISISSDVEYNTNPELLAMTMDLGAVVNANLMFSDRFGIGLNGSFSYVFLDPVSLLSSISNSKIGGYHWGGGIGFTAIFRR